MQSNVAASSRGTTCLPRRLRDDAGLASIVLPRTTATQFDLDTPSDLAILALSEGLPPELAEAAEAGRVSRAAVSRFHAAAL